MSAVYLFKLLFSRWTTENIMQEVCVEYDWKLSKGIISTEYMCLLVDLENFFF